MWCGSNTWLLAIGVVTTSNNTILMKMISFSGEIKIMLSATYCIVKYSEHVKSWLHLLHLQLARCDSTWIVSFTCVCPTCRFAAKQDSTHKSPHLPRKHGPQSNSTGSRTGGANTICSLSPPSTPLDGPGNQPTNDVFQETKRGIVYFVISIHCNIVPSCLVFQTINNRQL